MGKYVGVRSGSCGGHRKARALLGDEERVCEVYKKIMVTKFQMILLVVFGLNSQILL